MITEAKLILPQNDNDGNPVAHWIDDACMNICAMFGGVTRREAWGQWVFNGALYSEPVVELVIAGDFTQAENQARLRNLALHYGELMVQLSVYLCMNGKVEFLVPDLADAIAA